MANALTDQHNMVKKETYRGGGWPWGQQVQDHTGFSMEIFRGGHHILSLNAIDGTGRLRNGDEILEVNLGPITIAWHGKLYTSDDFTREYDARITIRVSLGLHTSGKRYSAIFAERYQQQVDPLEQAQQLINSALVKAAERDTHDDLGPTRLRTIVTNYCRSLPELYGVSIDELGEMSFVALPDPRKVEIDAELHKGVIIGIQKDIERDQRGRDADSDILIDTKKLTSSVVRNAKLKQLADYLAQGYSLRDIVTMDEDMPIVLLSIPEYKERVEQILLESPSRRTIDAMKVDDTDVDVDDTDA